MLQVTCRTETLLEKVERMIKERSVVPENIIFVIVLLEPKIITSLSVKNSMFLQVRTEITDSQSLSTVVPGTPEDEYFQSFFDLILTN